LRSRLRTLLRCLAVAGALAVIGPAPALAAEPMPCRGVSFTDAADAAPNRDIRAGWFSIADGRLTANLRLAQVDQELEIGKQSATFTMYYGARRPDGSRSKPHYAEATTDGERWSFEYGEDSGGPRQGATTGSVQTGRDGVIEIVIPSVHATLGDTLVAAHARSFARELFSFTGGQTDFAPDGEDPQRGGGYGADFLAEPCPAPQTEPKPTPESGPPPGPRPEPGAAPGNGSANGGQPTTPPPGSPPPGSPPPGSPPPASPPPASPPPASAPARFAVTVPRLRASSLARARSLRVRVRPSLPVTSLIVALRKGGRTFARARRASLIGPATVKLVVRRRIRRGTYRLTVSGRTPEGRAVTRAVTVRVA